MTGFTIELHKAALLFLFFIGMDEIYDDVILIPTAVERWHGGEVLIFQDQKNSGMWFLFFVLEF